MTTAHPDFCIDKDSMAIPFPTNFKIRKEKRYLICSNWWRRWCDYTNFDETEVLEDKRVDTTNEQITDEGFVLGTI